MRRTVATLLVVPSLLLLASPVSASDDRLPTPETAPAVVLAAPAPVPTVMPVAIPAPAAAAPALTAPATPTPVRHLVKAVRPKAPSVVTDLDDAAYDARLQAELCQARQIFCGLDRNGRYPAS